MSGRRPASLPGHPTRSGYPIPWFAASRAEQLIEVLDSEEMDQEIRISLRMRIEERGSEYRISVVSRRSGEWKQEQ